MVQPAGAPQYVHRQMPKWLDGVVLTGAALAKVGLRPPILAPENAILIEAERI
jgi:alpha-galactosidase